MRLAPQRLYFHIHKVGNTSAASIPIAVSDAVAEASWPTSRPGMPRC